MTTPAMKVLLIEDNAGDAMLISHMLSEESGVSVEHVARLSDGMARLDSGHFDLVLLDLGLPDSQGIGTLRKLREERPEETVIVLTGLEDEELALQAIASGSQDYLVKGKFDRDVLLRSVRYSLERRQSIKALKNALAEAEEGRRLLNALMENIPEGIAITGGPPDFPIKLISRFGLELSGQSIPTMKDVPAGYHRSKLHIFLPDGVTVPKPEQIPLYRAARFGEDVRNEEFVLYGGDGRRIDILIDAVPIRDTEGNIIAATNSWRDITERKRAEKALRRNEERMRRAFQTETVGVIFFDAEGRIIDANDTFLRMSGYAKRDVESKSLSWQILTPTEWMKDSLDQIAKLKATGYVGPYEKEYFRKDGSRWWALFSGQSLGDGTIIEYVIDITERKQMEDRLKRSKALSDELNRINMLVHSTLDTKSVMMSTLEGAQATLRADGAAVGIFEEASSEVLSIRYYLNVPESLKDQCCSPEEAKGIQFVANHRDAFAFNDISGDERVNSQFWMSFGFSSMLAAPLMIRNEVIGAIIFFSGKHVFFDEMHIDFARKMGVSLSLAFENARLYEQRGKMEEEMRHMAHHDPLTGLPNRRLFLDIIELEREQANRNRKRMAVLFLDLDRFKEVNDTLGHDVGNKLLTEVSSRLKSRLRKSDTIARIGGDEFNIILADITRPEDTADVARSIIASFREPFRIDGQELNITTSVGISIYPDDNENIDTLLRYADIAMYHAKELGRNRFQFYDSSINVKSLESIRLEGTLKRSLDFGEMEIYYQPLVDIRTGRVVCAEALARWHHPDKGLLFPTDFIPAAEETGFINELGEWSLKAVCRQMKAWLDAGGTLVHTTVNLSARQFQDPELVAKIFSILKETGIPPVMLGIEITETVAMSDVERSALRMHQLAKMGIEVCIDDFGTGYSSLNYLKRLPIDRLKIDKTFVRDIAIDPDDRSIVKAVTAMAHSMKMKVVAEGVETKAQLEFLRKTGCDEMQGFLFSEALPADRFKELVTAGK